MYRARRFPSLKSASANRTASSGDAPPAINSRQRSSRCCESSSTTSASRPGERRNVDRRGRTCSAQSGMFVSRCAPPSLDECFPCLLLLSQDASSFRSDLVQAAAPLLGLLDPSALDPSALLESIEQGIKRIDMECEPPAGTGVDQLTQLVAVTGPRIKQCKDKQLGRSSLQLPIKRPSVHTCHEQISYSRYQKIKPQSGGLGSIKILTRTRSGWCRMRPLNGRRYANARRMENS